MNLPKLPHNLKCGLDRLQELLDSGEDLRKHAHELRRLIDDGNYLIKVGARRNDPYFREIDAAAYQEARERAERQEYNTHRD